MIEKEQAIAIVMVVMSHHFHHEYDEELDEYILSKWDNELLTICKEICAKIRDEADDERG